MWGEMCGCVRGMRGRIEGVGVMINNLWNRVIMDFVCVSTRIQVVKFKLQLRAKFN